MKKHTKTTGSVLMAVGAVLMILGSQGQLSANVSGQGSFIGTIEPATELALMQPKTVLAAAPESNVSLGVLAFGMLMMLIGFGFHAWIVLRQKEVAQRKVPVRAAVQRKTARTSRRQAEVIWIERTIRF